MKKKQKIKAIKIIIILLIVFILHFIGILSPLESKIVYFLNPLFSTFYKFGSQINIFYKQQQDKRNLGDLLKDCKIEIERLTAENAKLKILEEENEKLRKYLNFSQKTNLNYILANVISRNDVINYSDYDKFLLIDKGKDDGLVDGLIVINENGIVVGKIVKTKSHTSKVSLLISRDCKIAATILNDDKTSGITEGELGLTVKMNFIPQTENLNIGDIVITSGLEKNIPRGLVIGRISQIEKESNEVWQNATLEPIIDFDDLTIVAVILPLKK